MIRTLALLPVILFSVGAGASSLCARNDFKACEAALKKSYAASQGTEFISAYDDVCSTNSKFKCVKTTVMGNIDQQMQSVREEHKGATLFKVKNEDSELIFTFEKK